MNFNGFQKLTLLDFPGKVACTLFLAGCNFRCPFCHNASLVTDIDTSISYSDEEILKYLKKRVGILEGVCITGGEPLLNSDLESFLVKVKELGYPVKLDTNGYFPKKLKNLIDKKLVDYVAMDVKNCQEKYALTVGVENLDISPVLESVNLLKTNVVDYEFRTTIVKEFHTVEDIKKMGEWVKGAKNHFLQNFVDSGNLIQGGLSEIDKDILEKMKDILASFVTNAEIRGI